jgi:hypothetical protein
MPRIRLKVRALVVPTEGEKHYADAATEHEVGEEEAARLVGHGVADEVAAAPAPATKRGKAEQAALIPDPPAEADPPPAGRYRRTDMKAKDE